MSETAEQRARQIAAEVLRRRRNGEPLTDAAVLQQHPDLAAPLQKELRRMGFVSRAAAEAFGDDGDAQLATPPPDIALADGLQALLAGSSGVASGTPRSASAAADTPRSSGPDIRRTMVESEDDKQIRSTRSLSGVSVHGPQATGVPAPAGDAAAPFGGEAAAAAPPEGTSKPAPDPGGSQPRAADAPAAGVSRFAPEQRQPTAFLQVLDDGQLSAELIRIRQSSFVIGRRLGDLVIPSDAGIDAAHVEISYGSQGGRWKLRDLNSHTGTLVRARRVLLRSGRDVVIGRQRLRYVHDGDGCGCLVAVDRQTMQPLGGSYLLQDGAYTIGRDPSCDFAFDDDQLDLRHARLQRDPQQQNRWLLEDLQSFNGVWAAVRQVLLTTESMFQLGEQRFLFGTP